MPRGKIITTEKLVEAVNKYAAEHPGEKISSTDISNYIEEKYGLTVGAYLIRRDEKAKELIDSINEQNEKIDFHASVPVFHPLDVDKFLRKNSNKSSLKQALQLRDKYYGQITEKAGDLADMCTDLSSKLSRAEQENKRLKEALAAKIKKEELAAVQEKERQIEILKKAIEDYVYPAAADAILTKCGFIDSENTILNPDHMDSITADAGKEIKETADSTDDNVADQQDSSKKEDDPIDDLLKGFE